MKAIELRECPEEMRAAAEKLLAEMPEPWELRSVIVNESTPYIDKSKRLLNYEAILCKCNTFIVLSYLDDGTFSSLHKSMFTIGTVERLLETAPAWMHFKGTISADA